MRIWKIVSGILSIALSAFILFQSFFAGLGDILLQNGGSSGAAGVIVAILVLTGGIMSIIVKKGSVGGNVAIAIILGLAMLIGFIFAGSFPDLAIYAIWCLLCAVIALLDLAINRGYTREEEDYEDEAPHVSRPVQRTVSVPLKTVVLERNPQRRNALIDILPEHEAKNYLKQIMTAFLTRQPVKIADEDGGLLRPVLTAVFFVVGVLAAIGITYFAVTASHNDKATVDARTPTPAPTVQSTQPAAPPPSALVPPTVPSAGSGDLGDYHVNIEGFQVVEDYDGNPAIVIDYTWTNNSDETKRADVTILEKAFQDGVQLEAAFIADRSIYDYSTSAKDIRPGTTIDVQCAFTLTSETSNVEFELSELFSFSDDIVSMDFNLNEPD